MGQGDTGRWISPHRLGRSGHQRIRLDPSNAELLGCRLGERTYLFKKYDSDARRQIDGEALDALVGWRTGLPAGQRRRLDAGAAWPHFGVGSPDQPQGVLVPYADPEFLMPNPTGPGLVPRTLGWLVPPSADQPRPRRRPVPLRTKLSVLAEVIDTVLWFHDHDVVVNDVQFENVLFSTQGHGTYFVDCDSMVVAGRIVSPPAAPAYLNEVVRASPGPSRATDFAKIAWLAVWVVLDQPDLLEIPNRLRSGLAGMLRADVAEFLLAAHSAADFGPAHTDRWRRLVREWRRPESSSGAGPGGRSGPPLPGERPGWASPALLDTVLDRLDQAHRVIVGPAADRGVPPACPVAPDQRNLR
ncbi:MAG: hypothetical protein HKP61_16130 [Dactylosporangium sp.]|nr:hypothetical protein [Dactylosporangium sp.]NNJ62434.1 hypothetical protein [Dactylosporangium sp.]